MRSVLALYALLVLCRFAAIALRAVDGVRIAPLLPLAALRDSTAAALVGALALALAPRATQIAFWGLYVFWAIAAIVNVPVSRIFGTPTTAMMLLASGGAISDSFRAYVSVSNVVGLIIVVLGAVMIPFALPEVAPTSVIIGLSCLLLLSHIALRSVQTRGLHRDPVVTVIRTLLARTRPRRIESAVLVGNETRADLRTSMATAAHRNVIWISLESTSARYLAPYGATRDVTPNLTKLAQEGWIFERAYAVCPESIKGLASWLCSFTPTPHTSPQAYEAGLFPAVSLAEVLKSSGYSTAMFHSGRFDYLGMAEVLSGRGFDVLRDAGTIAAKVERPFGVDEDSVVDAVLEYLDAASGEPAFVAYLPIAGHHPYVAPGAAHGSEKSEVERYLLDLAHGDRALGKLFEGIRSRGLWNNTLLVVHGDHGEAFGEHDANCLHTFRVYEENVHVPLFVVAPGSSIGSARVPNLVALVDLAPTVADLLGVQMPPSWEGTSALSPRPRVIRMFADYGVEQLALRDDSWKLVWTPETGRPELYDVSADPFELSDVADAHPERVAAYVAELARLRQRAPDDAQVGRAASKPTPRSPQSLP